MTRPRKFRPGDPIPSLDALWAEIEAGRYVMEEAPRGRLRSVHGGWAASWQFRMAAQAIRQGRLRFALPNPDHPDNRKETPNGPR